MTTKKKTKTKPKACKCKTCRCEHPEYLGTFTLTFEHTRNSKGLNIITMSQSGNPIMRSACDNEADAPLICAYLLDAYNVVVSNRFKGKVPSGKLYTEKDMPSLKV